MALYCLETYAQSTEGNPIPTIYSVLQNNNNSQTYSFGGIGAISGLYYPQTGINGNPSLIANRKYSRGINVTGPIVFDVFKLVDFAYFFSGHPKNYIGIYFGYTELNKFFNKNINPITIKTTDISRFTSTSLSFAHFINQNFSYGINARFARPVSAVGLLGKKPLLTEEQNFLTFSAGLHYMKSFLLFRHEFTYENGLYISNLGTRVDYVVHSEYPKSFLPQTIHFGNAINHNTEIIKGSSLDIILAYQIEKLLVPTPPKTAISENGSTIIIQGKSPDITTVRSIFQSFYDAPDGFNEELQEFVHKYGLELRFTYDNIFQIAMRIGGIYAHPLKDDINNFTIGVRTGIYGFYIDYAKIPGFPQEYNRFNIGYVTKLPDGKLKFIN